MMAGKATAVDGREQGKLEKEPSIDKTQVSVVYLKWRRDRFVVVDYLMQLL